MSDNETTKPTCILALQGGGAIGAYHIGAFEALHEHAFGPDWVCGISIGAINGAIIAGNAPERRLGQLVAFWEAISWPTVMPRTGSFVMKTWEHVFSFGEALTLGQPGFFSPRSLNPYLASPGISATSFYDTKPLHGTLTEVIDFDRLRRNATRFSVGATDVQTGELKFFDTHAMRAKFSPEHIVASCSLPPAFPATSIDGRTYWDGGCVSNTPLQAVLDDTPPGHSVVFVIDLWNIRGTVPDTMAAVEWRAKQIQYASRTQNHVQSAATKLKLREAQRRLGTPNDAKPNQRVDIVHIIYRPGADQIPASDAEFSRASIAERRAAGLADMRRALAARPWERPHQPAHLGCVVHRVTSAGVSTLDGA